MKKKAKKELRQKDIKRHAIDIIRLIPDSLLSDLAKTTKVDYYAKELTGVRIFYLLLYSLLTTKNLTQRYLAEVFCSGRFKKLFNIDDSASVTHGSLSVRLSLIDLSFFRQAYERIYSHLSSLYTEKEIRAKHLVRIDSTMVAEGCNKLKRGMTVGKKPTKEGREHRKQLKFTMAYDGFAVKGAKVFCEQSFLSEDLAMPAVLEGLVEEDAEGKNIYVLDRGFCALYNYSSADRKGAKFVGRIKTDRKLETVESLMREDTDRDLGNLFLDEDISVRLFDRKKNGPSDDTFRVLKAHFKVPRDTTRPANKGKVKRVENQVYFITNCYELTAQEVAECYRRRWAIEVLFKVLKQHFGFSHFTALSNNGVLVLLYMTLIAAMLIMIYKRENENLYEGERALTYSCAKTYFTMELNEFIDALIMAINGHSPDIKFGIVLRRPRIP